MTSRTTGQHILPRLLLEGFASHSKKKQIYTFLFREGGAKGIPVNVLDAAKRRLFYGEPSDTGVEDALARHEGHFGPAVVRIRKTRTISADDREPLYELIANLSIRTDHLRTGMTDGIERVFGIARDVFSGDQAAAVMRGMCDADPSLIRKPVREAIRNIPGFPRDPRHHLFVERQLEELALNQMQGTEPLLGGQLQALFRTWESCLDWSHIATTSHISGLQKGAVPQPRVEFCRSLTWEVVTTAPNSLILGDFGPCGLCAESGEWRPLSVLGTKVLSILLPLAHDCLVVGYAGESMPAIREAELRRATAAQCAHFFIASQDSGQERDLTPLIGSCSALLSDREYMSIQGGLCDPAAQAGQESAKAAVHDLTIDVVESAAISPEDVKELAGLSEAVAAALNTVGLPMETQLRVVVTEDVLLAVQDAGRLYGVDSGISLANRSVEVCGRTVYAPGGSPLVATVVLSGALWATTSPVDRILRYYVYIGQIGHMLIRGKHLVKSARDNRSDPQSFQEELNGLADEVLDVHDAHCLAVTLLSLIVTVSDSDGNALAVGETLATTYAGAVNESVKRLVAVEAEVVGYYRSNSQGLDDIIPSVGPPLRDLLLVLAHLAALAEGDAMVRCRAAISRDEDSKRLLEDVWDGVVYAFRCADQDSARRAIVRFSEDVLARMGLYVDDLSDGARDLIVGEPEPPFDSAGT